MIKQSARPANEDRPFWLELEEMLQSDALDGNGGYLAGSMSGESWRAFLKTVRDEVLERLHAYTARAQNGGFCASSLGSFVEEQQKIERAYLRNLAVLYRSAEKAYKTLSG
jgi:hypothetical protein